MCAPFSGIVVGIRFVVGVFVVALPYCLPWLGRHRVIATTANQRCSCQSGPGASRVGREAVEAARGRSGLLNIISLEIPPATNYYYNHCNRHPSFGSSAQRCFRDPPQQLQSRANRIGARRSPPLRLYDHLCFDVAGQP